MDNQLILLIVFITLTLIYPNLAMVFMVIPTAYLISAQINKENYIMVVTLTALYVMFYMFSPRMAILFLLPILVPVLFYHHITTIANQNTEFSD